MSDEWAGCRKVKVRVRQRVVLPILGGPPAPAPRPKREARTVHLHIRMAPTEVRGLQALADRFATTKTNVLVHLLAEAIGKSLLHIEEPAPPEEPPDNDADELVPVA